MRLLTFPACSCGRGAGASRAAAGPGLRRDPSGLPGSREPEPDGLARGHRHAHILARRRGVAVSGSCSPPGTAPGASLGLGRQQGDEDGGSAPAVLAPLREAL